MREEFQSFVDALKEVEKKYNDPGAFLDCIVWNDGDTWIACIDTSEQGELDQCKCLTNYIDSHEFATFSAIDMVTYSVQIHHEINILEIVVAGAESTFLSNQIQNPSSSSSSSIDSSIVNNPLSIVGSSSIKLNDDISIPINQDNNRSNSYLSSNMNNRLSLPNIDYIQQLKREVDKLKRELINTQESHRQIMEQLVKEEQDIRNENLRLQRKLQLEVDRREQLCRQLSESESSLEMDEERALNERIKSFPRQQRTNSSQQHLTRSRTVSSPSSANNNINNENPSSTSNDFQRPRPPSTSIDASNQME
ncbi:unnamed protein product [Rotaria sp. Silwood1]|nr:unnamed protein product [Rotaria sp. Silwood1]